MSSAKKYLKNLEKIKCNLCGSDDYIVLCEKERWDLPLKNVICKNCGLIYINPRPSVKDYQNFYESDYRIIVSGTDEGLSRIFDSQKKMIESEIADICEKNIQSDKVFNIMDIGSSYGGTLQGFREKYPKAKLFGIEPVIKNAEYSIKKTGADIFNGILEDYNTDKKFDIILLARTLNHSLDPKANLKKIRSMLSDNGIFILIQHDFVSELCRKEIDKVAQMTHPYNFYRESIKYFFDQMGFRISDYKDSTLDGPDKKTMRKMTIFKHISIVGKRDEIGCNKIEKPDANIIVERIKSNERSRENFLNVYKKWKRPNIFMRIYRLLLRMLKIW